MIQAVIFDMDGVLVDSEAVYMRHLYNKLLEFDGTLKIESFYPVVGSTIKKTKELALGLIHKDVDDPFFSNYFDHIFDGFTVDYPSILREGVHETLAFLSESGYKLALASSSPEDNIASVVDTCGLRKYFHCIISGHMFKESKPHPEIYLHTASALNVTPDKCLIIEDSNYGITAGIRAGMKVAAFKDERFAIDQSQAHCFIESIGKIPDVIKMIDKG